MIKNEKDIQELYEAINACKSNEELKKYMSREAIEAVAAFITALSSIQEVDWGMVTMRNQESETIRAGLYNRRDGGTYDLAIIIALAGKAIEFRSLGDIEGIGLENITMN